MEVSIKNVSKKLGGKNILNNINFDVSSGDCIGLVGPNGAGKTTLIRILLGLYQSEGNITFDSIPKSKIEMDKRKIMFMLDTSGLMRNLNVSENIEFFHRIYCKGAKSRQRIIEIEDILNKIDLLEYKNAKVKTLSRGMKQRLSLGRTMVARPSLLIMDEPYLALDVEAQFFLTQYIMELKKEGCTILISSHDLSHLEKICDGVVFIKKGTIVSENRISNKRKSESLEEIYKKVIIGNSEVNKR